MPSRLTILLGQFKPSRFHELTIANELQDWLSTRGVTAECLTSKGRMPIEVRKPEEHIKLSTDHVINKWHRDGLGGYKSLSPASETDLMPSILWMILWSNGTPTELMDKDGDRIYFQPFDVAAINNHDVYHRRPPTEEGRWFVRLANPILPLSMI